MHHDDKNVLSISILMFKYISSDLKEKNIENGIFFKNGSKPSIPITCENNCCIESNYANEKMKSKPVFFNHFATFLYNFPVQLIILR